VASPLLCAPDDKARLETRNGVDQLDYISYLVNDIHAVDLRESHVREFHKIAIKDIYPCGGRYRDARFRVVITGSQHELPPASRVPSLIADLLEDLNQSHETRPAIDRAALALWRVNWIHPFNGGNGRTARALAYLILCLDLGIVPPGRPQFPTVIYNQRNEYVSALKAADASVLNGGEPDLDPVRAIIEDAITRQLATAIESLGSPGHG
jgi:Fic family protein